MIILDTSWDTARSVESSQMFAVSCAGEDPGVFCPPPVAPSLHLSLQLCAKTAGQNGKSTASPRFEETPSETQVHGQIVLWWKQPAHQPPETSDSNDSFTTLIFLNKSFFFFLEGETETVWKGNIKQLCLHLCFPVVCTISGFGSQILSDKEAELRMWKREQTSVSIKTSILWAAENSYLNLRSWILMLLQTLHICMQSWDLYFGVAAPAHAQERAGRSRILRQLQ